MKSNQMEITELETKITEIKTKNKKAFDTRVKMTKDTIKET